MMEMNIKITDSALRRIKDILAAPENKDHAIRLGARGNAKCALTYYMGIQREPQPGDRVYRIDGISLFIDPLSDIRMKGIEVDYLPEMNGSGFIFRHCSEGLGTGYRMESDQ